MTIARIGTKRRNDIFRVRFEVRGRIHNVWFGHVQSADAYSLKVLQNHPGSRPMTRSFDCGTMNPSELAIFMNSVSEPIPLPFVDDKDLQSQQKAKPCMSLTKVEHDLSSQRKRQQKRAIQWDQM